jgi:hypothetical protein
MRKSKVKIEADRAGRSSGPGAPEELALARARPEKRKTIMTGEHRDTVTVTFNGAGKEVSYQPDALVQALLDAARRAFGVESQHLLSLFTGGGTELDDKKTARDAGVTPGMLLVLRQSTVKGGA